MKLQNVFRSFVILVLATGCYGNAYRGNVTITAERNGNLVRAKGTLKIVSQKDDVLAQSMILTADSVQLPTGKSADAVKGATITFREVNSKNYVCPESIVTKDIERRETTEFSGGDDVREVEVKIHFNLNRTCENPYLETQMAVHKSFLNYMKSKIKNPFQQVRKVNKINQEARELSKPIEENQNSQIKSAAVKV